MVVADWGHMAPYDSMLERLLHTNVVSVLIWQWKLRINQIFLGFLKMKLRKNDSQCLLLRIFRTRLIKQGQKVSIADARSRCKAIRNYGSDDIVPLDGQSKAA